jgi:hypothetical protein
VGAESGSSITNGCRVKTERPSGLSDGLFGSGGTNEHSSVANSHENSFAAAPALWRPYFWDHPRISYGICKYVLDVIKLVYIPFNTWTVLCTSVVSCEVKGPYCNMY